MVKYVQTNEQGYIISLTSEPILMGLFMGSPGNYKEVSDGEGEVIEALLKVKHSSGEGLHIKDITKKLDGEDSLK